MFTQAELNFLVLALGQMSRTISDPSLYFMEHQIESVTNHSGGPELMAHDGAARGKLLVKLATMALHSDSPEVAVIRGKALAKLFMLPKKRTNGRYDTAVGDKTETGLILTVERLFTDVDFASSPEFKEGG